VACGLVYAQNAKVRVPADVTTETITFVPRGVAPAAAESRAYYDNTTNQFYYYDGNNWIPFGSGGSAGPKTVATRIVAVRRNPPDPALDSDLTGKTADYICDGTNDQHEINLALNDVSARGGGVVYLLEGTYIISDVMSPGETDRGIVMHTNTAIIGAGAGTVIRPMTSSVTMGVIYAKSVNHILISQLMLNGDDGTGSARGWSGITFRSVTFSKIDRVWFQSMQVYNIYLYEYNDNNIISNNHMQKSGYMCIALGTSSNNIISDNYVYFQSMFGIGIWLDGNSSRQSSNNIISGNNQGNGIELDDYCYNNIISGNNVHNLYSGIRLYDNSNNTISGNSLCDISLYAMYLDDTSNNTVLGNNIGYPNIGIALTGGGGCSNSVFLGNILYVKQGGILLDENSDNNVFSSNIFYCSSNGLDYPIWIDSADSENNYLVGNLVSSWPASYNRINDRGTNTQYTDKVKITLEPGGYSISGSTLTPTGPTSFLRLAPTGSLTLGNPAIADGKSAGDILILENTANFIVTINDNTNVQLFNNQQRRLDQNDSLTLLWDNTDWIEVGYSHNPPDLF
jgi:parallel beta-helix repeat protein